ncbi:MAG: hypothetical protein K0R38_6006, partial [Polyangiaceae bacterium]|nr:hypothetical protein [Polyangiaceae bacterium]
FTIDAGPHVKVLVEPQHVAAMKRALSDVEGVLRVLESTPGPDAEQIAEFPE